jgi:hypothetical protein
MGKSSVSAIRILLGAQHKFCGYGHLGCSFDEFPSLAISLLPLPNYILNAFLWSTAGESIRIEYPVPVLHPSATGPNILQGVNYASADAGILDNTGSIFVRSSQIPGFWSLYWFFSFELLVNRSVTDSKVAVIHSLG